jgi:hypothetical protein
MSYHPASHRTPAQKHIYADNYNAINDSRKRIEEAYENYPARQENLERKLVLSQLVGAKFTYTNLTPTRTTFLDTMHELMVKFIWQGRRWKHPNFV